MRKLLSSWWFWLIVPGGSAIGGAIWLYKRGKARQASVAAAAAGSSAFNADPLAAAQSAAVKAANWAKAYADSLRGAGISGDPTAQALLGLSGAALAPATPPADVTANAAKAKTLRDHIVSLLAQLATAQRRYADPGDHNGGQKPEEEAAYERSLQGSIDSDNAALAALGAIS